MHQFSFRCSLELGTDFPSISPSIALINTDRGVRVFVSRTEVLPATVSTTLDYSFRKLVTLFLPASFSVDELKFHDPPFQFETRASHDVSKEFSNFDRMKLVSVSETSLGTLVGLENQTESKCTVTFSMNSCDSKMNWKSLCKLSVQFIEHRLINSNSTGQLQYQRACFLFNRPIFMRNNTTNTGPGNQLKSLPLLPIPGARSNTVVATPTLICNEILVESPIVLRISYEISRLSLDCHIVLREKLRFLLDECSRFLSNDISSDEERELTWLVKHIKRDIIKNDLFISTLFSNLDLFDSGQFPSFKPSVEKNNKSLAYLPINLHHHEFHVASLPYKQFLGSSIETTTVGAFSAHSMGFKNGGLSELLDSIRLRNPKSGFFGINKEVVTGKKLEWSHIEDKLNFEFRLELVFAQALTTLISTFAARILSASDLEIERILDIGFLFQVESLLSTYTDEQFMISDMKVAMQHLSRVRIVLVPAATILPIQCSSVINDARKKIGSDYVQIEDKEILPDHDLEEEKFHPEYNELFAQDSDFEPMKSASHASSLPDRSFPRPLLSPKSPTAVKSFISNSSLPSPANINYNPPASAPKYSPPTLPATLKSASTIVPIVIPVAAPRPPSLPKPIFVNHSYSSSVPDLSIPPPPPKRYSNHGATFSDPGILPPLPSEHETMPPPPQRFKATLESMVEVPPPPPPKFSRPVPLVVPVYNYSSSQNSVQSPMSNSVPVSGFVPMSGVIPMSGIPGKRGSDLFNIEIKKDTLSPMFRKPPAPPAGPPPLPDLTSFLFSIRNWPFLRDSVPDLFSNAAASMDISYGLLKSDESIKEENIMVHMGLPPKIYNLVSKIKETLNLSELIVRPVPILINQGVNEMQTAADNLGKAAPQDYINECSIYFLDKYFDSFSKYSNRVSDESSLMLIPLISDCLEELKTLFHDSRGKKNYDILVLASVICRLLNGSKVVCCKSAKDRTSMSVTAEECLVVMAKYGIGPREIQSMLDLLRSEGVRRDNVVKNTKKPFYAFNAIQRSFLPAVLVPPAEACGKTVS